MTFDSTAFVQQSARPRRAVLRRARALDDAVAAATVPLAIPGARELSVIRARVQSYVRNRMIPLIQVPNLPVIVAIVGSSGVGKSALANAIAGKEFTLESVRRPTTLHPEALVHSSDADAWGAMPISRSLHTTVRQSAIPGVVMIDCPAIDVAHSELREATRQILAAASAAVFVSTSSRYGDADAWDFLSELRRTGLAVYSVLNRIPQLSTGQSLADFMRLLQECGCSPEWVTPLHEGELASAASRIDEIRTWCAARAECAQRDDNSLGGQSEQPIAEEAVREVIETNDGGRKTVRRRRRQSRDQVASGFSLPRENVGALTGRIVNDIEMLAQGMDHFHIALIDSVDLVREGAAAPLEKLATNISMGRFGQGAPSAVWDALAHGDGVLADVAPGKRARARSAERATARDVELALLMNSIDTSVRVALAQGLTTAMLNIDSQWEHSALDMVQFAAKTHERVDISSLVDGAVQAWRADITASARAIMDTSLNTWFGADGAAALIGIAASGVTDAAKMTRQLGCEQAVWDVREALARRVREAMDMLVSEYVRDIEALSVPSGDALREALAQYIKTEEVSFVH